MFQGNLRMRFNGGIRFPWREYAFVFQMIELIFGRGTSRLC